LEENFVVKAAVKKILLINILGNPFLSMKKLTVIVKKKKTNNRDFVHFSGIKTLVGKYLSGKISF
jgi:hypothetical protein